MLTVHLFFFFCSYFHISKAIYYQGFFKKKIWFSGLVLFLALTIEAFTGYVLPWGQMSFWAATVITNFFSIIPVIGNNITEFLWGGFTVNEATLKRFYSLHFILGFLIAAIAILHLIVLHDKGSSSPKNENFNQKANFIPLYGEEMLFSILIFLSFFTYVVCFRPNFFMHPANYEPANCLVTPPHIVPEWYLLPFYTILRVIPDKTYGVLLMLLSLLILFFLPFYGTPKLIKNKTWNFFFWTFICNFLILGYLGSCEPEPIYIFYGQLSTFYYFFFLSIFLPIFKNFQKTFFLVLYNFTFKL